MLTNTPSLDLVEFVETMILPKYAEFDKAHNLAHVTSVIRRALKLVPKTGTDINMVYAIAAYHDLGLRGPRAIHHITGGRILAADKRLLRWFTPQQIVIMREAVEDHRASASHAPRSIYGKIVAEADRELDPDRIYLRAVEYGLANYPELDREGQYNRFRDHITAKYGRGGYIKLWIAGSDNERLLGQVRQTIESAGGLRRAFDEAYSRLVP